MTTPKAQYKGDGPHDAIDKFSDAFLAELRAYFVYGKTNVVIDPVWGHPADAHIAQVCEAMAWAKTELARADYDSKRPDIQAERKDLLKALRAAAKHSGRKTKLLAAAKKLRHLSRELDRRLSIDADPIGCASKIETMAGGADDATEAIDAMIVYVEEVGPLIDEMKDELRPEQKNHRIATELTLRVLRIVDSYEMPVTAVANKAPARPTVKANWFDQACEMRVTIHSIEPRKEIYVSDAVDLLKAIGDEIGLLLSLPTWRDKIDDCRREDWK